MSKATDQPGRATLVLGGARSGKSEFAEKLVADLGGAPVYIATGEAGDDEMRARINAHQARRGNQWRTIEAPLDPCAVIAASAPGDILLLDCITLWVANLMAAGRDVETETHRLCGLIEEHRRQIVLVSNEVGLGIVPENKLARQFRDLAGKANQMLAASCDRVVFVAAGLPLTLKGNTDDQDHR